MRVIEFAIFLDLKTDESYTPQKISIRANNSFFELQEIKQVEFEEPNGWFVIPLHDGDRDYIKTNLVQVCILQNQHSGRDTHIRQIKIFGPRDLTVANGM
jgi:anaphase-promoting complex subunit 10